MYYWETVPHATAVKTEPPSEINTTTDTSSTSVQRNEPTENKIKLEYDDWLNDVVYVGTTDGPQKANYELINKKLEKYDTEFQIVGDPLLWWRRREGSIPTLANVAKAVLYVPGSSVPSKRVFSRAPLPTVDPGFPIGGGANPLEGGALTSNVGTFWWKHMQK